MALDNEASSTSESKLLICKNPQIAPLLALTCTIIASVATGLCFGHQLLILLMLIPTLQGVSDHMAWEPAGDAGTSETALEISG